MQWNNRTEDNQYISGNSLRVYGVLYFMQMRTPEVLWDFIVKCDFFIIS